LLRMVGASKGEFTGHTREALRRGCDQKKVEGGKANPRSGVQSPRERGTVKLDAGPQ